MIDDTTVSPVPYRDRLQHLVDVAYAAGQCNALYRFDGELRNLKLAADIRDELIAASDRASAPGNGTAPLRGAP